MLFLVLFFSLPHPLLIGLSDLRFGFADLADLRSGPASAVYSSPRTSADQAPSESRSSTPWCSPEIRSRTACGTTTLPGSLLQLCTNQTRRVSPSAAVATP